MDRDRQVERTRDQLLERLRAMLVAEFELDPAQVTAGARLVEDLDLDSIDGVTIVVRLETQFQVSISDDEIQKMATVADIVEALAARLDAPQCP
ncbi:MAG: acyl carrier protein [Candidatus Binatia bacterium]